MNENDYIDEIEDFLIPVGHFKNMKFKDLEQKYKSKSDFFVKYYESVCKRIRQLEKNSRFNKLSMVDDWEHRNLIYLKDNIIAYMNRKPKIK